MIVDSGLQFGNFFDCVRARVVLIGQGSLVMLLDLGITKVCLLPYDFTLFSLLHKSLRIIVIQTQIGKISNVEFEGGC
jgi:hypothetical protein